MNDVELARLIEFLVGLRTKLNDVWKSDYHIAITLGDSMSGDYFKIDTRITVPKVK